MYVIETNGNVVPRTGGTLVFRVVDDENNPITNFWYTLSTGMRPEWEEHTKINETFTVVLQPNNDLEERSLTYTFYREVVIDDVLTEESWEITVTQSGLVLPETIPNVSLSNAAQTTSLLVEGSFFANILVSASWFTVTASNNDRLIITVEQNNINESRNGIVEIWWNDSHRTFTVTQEASGVTEIGGDDGPNVTVDDNGEITTSPQFIQTVRYDVTNEPFSFSPVYLENTVLPVQFKSSDVSWIYAETDASKNISVIVRRNPTGGSERIGRATFIDGFDKENTILIVQAAGEDVDGVNYKTPYTRFVQRQHVDNVFVTQSRMALNELDLVLSSVPFERSSVKQSEFVAPRGEDQKLVDGLIDGYDTYSLCANHSVSRSNGAKHDILRGTVLYVFNLPWIAGTPAIQRVKTFLKCDAYTPDGVDVSLVRVQRAKSSYLQNEITNVVSEKKVARRKTVNGSWQASVEEIELPAYDFVPSQTTTLGLLVKLNNMSKIRESWIEGSGGLILPVWFNFSEALPTITDPSVIAITIDDTGAALAESVDQTFNSMIISKGDPICPSWDTVKKREFYGLEIPFVPSDIALAEFDSQPNPDTSITGIPAVGGDYQVTINTLDYQVTSYTLQTSDTNMFEEPILTASGFVVRIKPQALGATARTGTVTLKEYKGETLYKTYVWTYYQDAGEEITTLALSAASASVDCEARVVTFYVTSLPNGATGFTVSKNVAWISHSISGNRVIVSVAYNAASSQRIGTVVVTANGGPGNGSSLNFTITQAANPNPFGISLVSKNVDVGGASYSFDVASGGGAQVSLENVALPSGSTAFITSSYNGTTKKVAVTASANEGSARINRVWVVITLNGEVWRFRHSVCQKGVTVTTTTYTNKFFKLGATGDPVTIGASQTNESGIQRLSVSGDTCWVVGSHVSLLGGVGYNSPVNLSNGTIRALSPTPQTAVSSRMFVRGSNGATNFYHPTYGDESWWGRTFPHLDYSSGGSGTASELTPGGSLGTVTPYITVSVKYGESSYYYIHQCVSRKDLGSPATLSSPTRHVYPTGNTKVWFLASKTLTGTKSHIAVGSVGVAAIGNLATTYTTLPAEGKALAVTAESAGLTLYVATSSGLYKKTVVDTSDTLITSGGWTESTQTAKVPAKASCIPNDFTNFNIGFLSSGELVVSGNFTSISGVSVKYLAKWNGSTWVQFNPDVILNTGIVSMDTYGNDVLLTGSFSSYSKTTPDSTYPTDTQMQPPEQPVVPDENVWSAPDPTHPLAVQGDPTTTIVGYDPSSFIVDAIRMLNAQAYSGMLQQLEISTLPSVGDAFKTQTGLGSISYIDTTNGVVGLNMRFLLLQVEAPTTFTPKRLSITTPVDASIDLPDGCDLLVNVWFRPGIHNFSTLSTNMVNASYWSGLGTTDGFLKKVCSFNITEEDVNKILVQPINGNLFGETMYGTFVVTPWIRYDGVKVGIEYNPSGFTYFARVAGYGRPNTGSNNFEIDTNVWKPVIRLLA